jgi:hypothetical protein
VLILIAIAGLACRRLLKPAYLEGRPAWQKAAYWATFGH